MAVCRYRVLPSFEFEKQESLSTDDKFSSANNSNKKFKKKDDVFLKREKYARIRVHVSILNSFLPNGDYTDGRVSHCIKGM